MFERVPDARVELVQSLGGETFNLPPPTHDLLHDHDLGVPPRRRLAGSYCMRLGRNERGTSRPGLRACPASSSGPSRACPAPAATGPHQAGRSRLDAEPAGQAVPPGTAPPERRQVRCSFPISVARGLRCWPECPSRPPPVVSGRASEPASAAWIDPVAVGRDGRRRRRSARVLERTSPRRGPRPSRTPTGSAARRARRWWPRDGRGVRRTAAIAPRALQLVRAAHDPRPCPATTSPRRRPSPSPSSSTSAARPLGPPRTRRGHDGRSGERTRLSPSRVRAGGSRRLVEGKTGTAGKRRTVPERGGSRV